MPIDGNYLGAGAGFDGEGVAVPIPDNPGAAKWCAARVRADPQGFVVLGWPVCVGTDRQSREQVVSPLLIGDARVFRGDNGEWRCERAEPAQGLVDASDEWHEVHRQVQAVHDAREERQFVQTEMQSLEDQLARAPLSVGVPDGWTVVRFSGRRIKHRLDDCVGEIIDLLPPQIQTRRGAG